MTTAADLSNIHKLKSSILNAISGQLPTINKGANTLDNHQLSLLSKLTQNTNCKQTLEELNNIVSIFCQSEDPKETYNILKNITPKKSVTAITVGILLTTAIAFGLVTGGIAVPVIAALAIKLTTLLSSLALFHGIAAATISLGLKLACDIIVLGALYTSCKKYLEYTTLSSIQRTINTQSNSRNNLAPAYNNENGNGNEGHYDSDYNSDYDSELKSAEHDENTNTLAEIHQSKCEILDSIAVLSSKNGTYSSYKLNQNELSLLSKLTQNTNCKQTLEELNNIVSIFCQSENPKETYNILKNITPKKSVTAITVGILLTTAIVFGLVTGGIAVPVIAALAVKLTTLLSSLALFHGIAAATISLGVKLACDVIVLGALYTSCKKYLEYTTLSSIQEKIQGHKRQSESQSPSSVIKSALNKADPLTEDNPQHGSNDNDNDNDFIIF